MRKNKIFLSSLLCFSVINAEILVDTKKNFSNDLFDIELNYDYNFATINTNFYFKSGQRGNIPYEESRFKTLDQKTTSSDDINIKIDPKFNKYFPTISVKRNTMKSQFSDTSDLLKYDTFQYKVWKDQEQNDIQPTIGIDYEEYQVKFDNSINVNDFLKLDNRTKKTFNLDIGGSVGYNSITNKTTFTNNAMQGYIDPETGDLTQAFYNEEGELHPGSASFVQKQKYITLGYNIKSTIGDMTTFTYEHEFDMSKNEDNTYDYKKLKMSNKITENTSFDVSVFKKVSNVEKTEFETQGASVGLGLKF